jgi:hypothetical protein
MSTLQQNWRKRQNRFCLEARGVEGEGESGWWHRGRNGSKMYVHMNKWIKKEKRLKIEFLHLLNAPKKGTKVEGNFLCSILNK